jgi:hypothetical protein
MKERQNEAELTDQGGEGKNGSGKRAKYATKREKRNVVERGTGR